MNTKDAQKNFLWANIIKAKSKIYFFFLESSAVTKVSKNN